MPKTLRLRLCAAAGLAFAAGFLAAPASAEPAAANATSCDRDCLIGFMDQYLDAVAANDPRLIEKATHLRYTEDGQELPLGDGLWGTASARGTYRHYVPDPETGNIGFFGTMREKGNPIFLTARLKVIDRKISEIEIIVPRDNTDMAKAGIRRLEQMRNPEAVWNEDVPARERLSRADLIRTANRYFTGLERNNPNGDYSFFADGCGRLENGIETSNRKSTEQVAGAPSMNAGGINVVALPCREQFATGFYQMVTRIRDRRFVAVDEQKGVVFAFGFFDHNGQVREATLNNGQTVPVNLKAPFTWEMGEAFKITKGKIYRVEAIMKRSPYGMPSGWPTDKLGYDPRTGPR